MTENLAKKTQEVTPQKNEFEVQATDRTTGNSYKAYITSNIDSGNLNNLQVCDSKPNHFIIFPACDCDRNGNYARNTSWFYFRITGLPTGMKVTIEARRMNILRAMYRCGWNIYRPCIKIGSEGKWYKIKERAILDVTDQNSVYAMFPITIDFDNKETFIEIAFCFPYTYEELMRDVEDMNLKYEQDKDIYFHRETQTRSAEGLDVPILTISSKDLIKKDNETYQVLEGVSSSRKYDAKKPIIFQTSRVHPGETPCSHALNGAIKLLLNNSEDSKLLLKHFVFKIVPILNPDGVYHGHFRKDRFIQNLKRFYKRPCKNKQPTCFAIRNLMTNFSDTSRMIFFSDFHAHSGLRNCFVYGNHCNYVRQVEARVFTKIYSKICDGFGYNDCDFSLYQMKSKDKNETIGKEGCARVMGYFQGSQAHSYTLEMKAEREKFFFD